MDSEEFKVKVQEAKAVDDDRGQWWQMIYNEQHAPAAQWFSERGWVARETSLTGYLDSVGRSTDSADPEAANMLDSISLVRAVKN